MRDSQQIDFSEQFRDYFSRHLQPIRYVLRPGPNLLHDLSFFNGLVHDARFQYRDIITSDDHVSIKIDRDRWELFDHNKSNELLSVTSVVEIHGIISINLGIDVLNVDNPADRNYSVDRFLVNSDYWNDDGDSYSMTILGHKWTMAIEIDRHKGTVELCDIESHEEKD